MALAEGTQILAHEDTLLATENRSLRKANEALSKRRRAKKTRIRQGGALTVEDAHHIMAQEELYKPIHGERRAGASSQTGGKSTPRRCGICGNTGHNSRTCEQI